MQGAAVLVLWYGGYLVYTNQLTSGALTALMLYTLNLAMAFAFLSSLYGDFMQVCMCVLVYVFTCDSRTECVLLICLCVASLVRLWVRP